MAAAGGFLHTLFSQHPICTVPPPPEDIFSTQQLPPWKSLCSQVNILGIWAFFSSNSKKIKNAFPPCWSVSIRKQSGIKIRHGLCTPVSYKEIIKKQQQQLSFFKVFCLFLLWIESDLDPLFQVISLRGSFGNYNEVGKFWPFSLQTFSLKVHISSQSIQTSF